MEDKFLNKKQVREITTLSITEITRKEKLGKFPKRVQLSDAPNGRVAWSYKQVMQWVADRMGKTTP